MRGIYGMNLALLSMVCMAAAKDTGAKAPEQSPVQFGSDEWGKWATSVTERLGVVEKAGTGEADINRINERIDDLEKRVEKMEGDAVADVAKSSATPKDVSSRLDRLERQVGM